MADPRYQQLANWINELLTGSSPDDAPVGIWQAAFVRAGLNADAKKDEKQWVEDKDAEAVVDEVVGNILKVYAARTPATRLRGPGGYSLPEYWDTETGPAVLLKELVIGSLLHGDFIPDKTKDPRWDPLLPIGLQEVLPRGEGLLTADLSSLPADLSSLPPDLVVIAEQVVKDHGNFLIAFPQHYSRTKRLEAVMDAEVAADRLDRYDTAIIRGEDEEPDQQFEDRALPFIRNFDANEVDIMNRAVDEHPKAIDRKPGTIYSLVGTLTKIAESPEFFDEPLLPIWGGDPAANRIATSRGTHQEGFASATDLAGLKKAAAGYMATRGVNIPLKRAGKSDEDSAYVTAFDEDLVPILENLRITYSAVGASPSQIANAIMDAIESAIAEDGSFMDNVETRYGLITGTETANENKLKEVFWGAEGGPIDIKDIGPEKLKKLRALLKGYTPEQAQAYVNEHRGDIAGSAVAEKQAATDAAATAEQADAVRAAQTGSIDDTRAWVKDWASAKLGVPKEDLAESTIDRAVEVFRFYGDDGLRALEALFDPAFSPSGVGPDQLPAITPLLNEAEKTKEDANAAVAARAEPSSWTKAVSIALNAANISQGSVSAGVLSALRLRASRVTQEELNEHVRNDFDFISTSKHREGLADPTDPRLLDTLRGVFAKALDLNFGADGFVDPNVQNHFENVMLPKFAIAFANELRANPRAYDSPEAREAGAAALANSFASGESFFYDPYGGPYDIDEVQKGLSEARRATGEGEAFRFLGGLGLQVEDTGDPALNRQFAIGEIGKEKWEGLVAQPPGALASQFKEQTSLTGDISLPPGFAMPGGVPAAQTDFGTMSAGVTDDMGRPYTPQEIEAGFQGTLPLDEQEEFDRNQESFESDRQRREQFSRGVSSFPGLPLSSGFVQKPILHPRTQTDPITGETRTFGYGDFPYSTPNTLEMQELLGGVAADDPEYLSFLIGTKDAPGPAFGLLERYPQLAGSFVKGERDKLREEAVGMDLASRGVGAPGEITYTEWLQKKAQNLADIEADPTTLPIAPSDFTIRYTQSERKFHLDETQRRIAEEQAQQRAAFADINATDFGDDPFGTARAEQWADAVAIPTTKPLGAHRVVGDDYSMLDPYTVGGQKRYPLKSYVSQHSFGVKPPSFATMFGEREPEFRRQYEASPQFQLQRERETESERTRKLRRGRTFVI